MYQNLISVAYGVGVLEAERLTKQWFSSIWKSFLKNWNNAKM